MKKYTCNINRSGTLVSLMVKMKERAKLHEHEMCAQVYTTRTLKELKLNRTRTLRELKSKKEREARREKAELRPWHGVWCCFQN